MDLAENSSMQIVSQMPGESKLEITVTNLSVNRLVGDAQPRVTKRNNLRNDAFLKGKFTVVTFGFVGTRYNN